MKKFGITLIFTLFVFFSFGQKDTCVCEKHAPNTASKGIFTRAWKNGCLKNGVSFILNKGTNYEFIITPKNDIRVVLAKSDSIVSTNYPNNTTSDRITFTATQSGIYTLKIADPSLPIQQGFIE